MPMYWAAEFFFFFFTNTASAIIHASLYSKGICFLGYAKMFHRKHPFYGCKCKTGDEGTLASQGSVEWVNFLLPPSPGKSFNDFCVFINIVMLSCLLDYQFPPATWGNVSASGNYVSLIRDMILCSLYIIGPWRNLTFVLIFIHTDVISFLWMYPWPLPNILLDKELW